MSTAVRSRHLVLGAFVTNGSGRVVVYTVPTDRTAILKDARIWFNAAVNMSLWCENGTDLGPIAQWVTTGSGNTYVVTPEPWCVLEEGDELVLYGSPSSTFYVFVSGALLLGDPS